MENTGVLTAAYRLVARNPRRYGGYAVHLAIAIIACGVVASHAFQQQAEFPLRVGQTAEVGGYDFTYEGVGTTLGAGIQTSYARVTVTRRGQFVANMLPAAFVGTDAATASAPTFLPAIAPGFYRDLYIVLEGYDQGGATAALNVIITPLVDWIWAGGVLLVAGSVFSLWPRRAMLAAPRSHRIFALWSELEYDYRMGKTPEPEYLALRAQYAAEAERALGAERAEDAARRSVAALESRIAARVAEIARLGSGEPALAVAAAPAGEGERG
jgi:cytochrome c-type biogenesis protein CcmF